MAAAMKFTKALLKTKLKATGIHLSMSVVVFVYLAWRIYFHWYPQPYFEIDGGWQGIRLIGAVDLVLGPFITFLIFDNTKTMRAIVFDLAVIATIQFGALAYGIYATYTQRPVAIVLIDEFVVSAIHEHYGGKLESVDRLKDYSDEHPPIIFSDVPRTPAGVDEMTRVKIEEGVLEHAQMQYYQPQEKLASALRELQLLFGQRLDNWNARDRFDAWLAANDKTADEVLIAPFTGRYGVAWLVFDQDGDYVDYF